MSSRSIASGFLASGSRRVFSKRRRRELGKAVAAVVEQLEKRVLLTNATLPASYTFDEGSHSAWSGWTVSTTPSDADIANDNYLSASSTLTVDTPYEHKSLHVHARIFILNVDFLDSPFDDPSGRFKVSVGGHDYTAGLIAVPENNSANLDDVGVHLGSQDWVWEADLDVPHVNSISNSNTASLTMSVQPNTGSSWGIDSVDVQYIDPKAPQCSCNCTVGPEGDSGTDANQLHSDAFGGGFDPSLFLSNSDQSVASDNGGNGSMGLPSLFQSVNGTVAAIDGASSSRWFDDAGGGSFTARYGVLDTLTHDSGNHTYSITDSSGQVSTYNDFTNGTASLRGKLIEVTDPSGTGDPNTTSYSYSSGKLSKIERTDGSGDYVRYNYTYLSSGSNSGKISSITLEEETGGTATPVRSEVFDYYTGGSGVDSHGHLGDLKSVILKDGGAITKSCG